MSTKKSSSKSPSAKSAKTCGTAARYKLNILIFIAAAIIFATTTAQGVIAVDRLSENFRPLSDVPALCYDEHEFDDGTTTPEGGYVCSITEYDAEGNPAAVVTDSDYAMFFYDKYVFSGKMNAAYVQITIATVGIIATLASVVGAIIYGIHNRGNCNCA